MWADLSPEGFERRERRRRLIQERKRHAMKEEAEKKRSLGLRRDDLCENQSCQTRRFKVNVTVDRSKILGDSRACKN